MTMRKPNKAQQVAELKNEISTVEAFMAPIVRECEQLDVIAKARPLTKPERTRLNELIELVHSKNIWLAKARNDLKAYYAFA